MKKKITLLFILGALIVPNISQAQTVDQDVLRMEMINKLVAMVQKLQTQLSELQAQNKDLKKEVNKVSKSLEPKSSPPPSKECLIAQDEFGELSDKMLNVQKDYEYKIDKVKNIHEEVVKLEQSRFSRENNIYDKLKLARNKIGYTCDHLLKLPDLPKRSIEKEAVKSNWNRSMPAEA